MKYLIVFFLFSTTVFANTNVDISEIGTLVHDEMESVADLSTNLDAGPSTAGWNLSTLNFRILTSVGISIPEIVSAKIQPEIEFQFKK